MGGGRLREVVTHGVRQYSERVGDIDPNGAVYFSLSGERGGRLFGDPYN